MKAKICVATVTMLFLASMLSMAFNTPAFAHTEGDPFTTPLIAGGGNPKSAIDVGDVLVWNDADFLYVKYVITDTDWCLTETHLHIDISLDGIPQKNGNPIPGHFDYRMKHDCVTEYTYAIPLTWSPCTEVYIAAHAVVQTSNLVLIDFEQFDEHDFVTSVATGCGDVNFHMTNSIPLEGLSIGDSAELTPSGLYPEIGTPDTSPPYENIVAFTVGGALRDDWVKDEGGTGAEGNVLSDPQDTTQIPLLWHAYSQYQAIVIDLSSMSNVQGIDFATIDLDHSEIWHFQYFDSSDTLIHQTTMGPTGTNVGDGVAYPITHSGPVSKVAIWGENNLGEKERLGYAIDNVEITCLEDETAWGAGDDFPGKNWATYFTYHVQPYEVLWPEGGTATIAFEDLPVGGGNDYDYNDFVTDVSVVGAYSYEGLMELKFTFEAQARGAAYHHDLFLFIEANTFGSSGIYTITLYETDGSMLISMAAPFDNTLDFDRKIFADTWLALPPNYGGWSGNTFDGSGVQPGRMTVVTFEFDTPFAFDLSTYTPDYVSVHGDNLFFDPYLYVWDTGEEIHITDPRLIVVPTDWEWPQETAAIWTVYPYNIGTGEGVTSGDPPAFTTYWYTETPTSNKWTP